MLSGTYKRETYTTYQDKQRIDIFLIVLDLVFVNGPQSLPQPRPSFQRFIGIAHDLTENAIDDVRQ